MLAWHLGSKGADKVAMVLRRNSMFMQDRSFSKFNTPAGNSFPPARRDQASPIDAEKVHPHPAQRSRNQWLAPPSVMLTTT